MISKSSLGVIPGYNFRARSREVSCIVCPSRTCSLKDGVCGGDSEFSMYPRGHLCELSELVFEGSYGWYRRDAVCQSAYAVSLGDYENGATY